MFNEIEDNVNRIKKIRERLEKLGKEEEELEDIPVSKKDNNNIKKNEIPESETIQETILNQWKIKKDEKMRIQGKMIRSFFWFLVGQFVCLILLISSKIITEIIFSYKFDSLIIYWYLSIFVTQIIALITISHKYMFSDNEDRILEYTQKHLK
ncbi:hypothetical protein EII29_10120 [Leptotrichia sp. OH3620_COT-345]|uniref:hypothetical protein n=1 Tax=Leptotrichia sp. OH3620_COT-345 TaxID=2491048 RepID=UPI000F655CF9|nr:hypothetical protein [Leptotrichia sp. OH3620_COT-345]RRD38453.1 hypothetical protein EII29_10120 [Leptotrichia sp. OH3620_COT-345]